ncbi:MAG: heavy metal-associated domain-containing protein, partial [Pseudomonadota bacterium]
MPFDQHREARRIDLVIPGMRCAGCMTAVEACLTSAPGVNSARANLSAHTARVEIMPGLTDAEALIEALAAEGYQARPYDPALHGGR